MWYKKNIFLLIWSLELINPYHKLLHNCHASSWRPHHPDFEIFDGSRLIQPLSLELIFKATLKLEYGNKKIQYGHQVAILKVMSLKINRLLSMATINMHIQFEVEIPKETWLMLRKPCRLQTDGWTDGRQGESSIPSSNFVGRGYKKVTQHALFHQV